MAAGRKEYELQMKLTAALASSFGSSFQGAMSTVKKLQTTLQNVKKVQGDISAYKKTQEAINATKAKVQEYESKHNALQSELAQTVQKEKDLQAALKESAKTTGKDSDEYKKLQKQLQATRNEKAKLNSQIKDNERATDGANAKIKEQQEKLSELSKSLQAAGVNTNQLTQENDKLEKAYNRVKKAQEDYARVNSAIEQNKAAISATKTELVKTVGIVGAAGTAFYKGFITPAANLQEQMSTVKALISADNENIESDMERLNAVAKKMGATTKFTAVEAGKALEYMGMAGWKASEMEAGLPGIMNLAAASGEDLGTVSDIVTDAMTAFGMTADRAGYFADVLARTATSANTDVGLMGETFQQVAPLAGAMGYTIKDMNVAVGLMANAGIKGSKSGVALKNVITNLAKPSDAAAAAMEKLGVSLTNTDGTTKSFEEVVKSLRKGFSGLTKSEKAAYAATIGGKQGMAGLLAIVNSSEKDFADLAKQIDNCKGAAEEMAATKLDNLNGDITLAKSAWDGLATTIGEMFLPNLRAAVTKVRDFLEKANEFAQNNPELIKQIAKVAAGLAALKIGSLAGKLGFLQLRGGVLNVVEVFRGLRVKMAESAAAAATGGGKFATLGKNIAGYFGSVKSSVGGVGTAINKLSGGTLGKFSGFIGNAFKNVFGGTIGKLGGFIGNSFKNVFGEVGGKIAGFLGPIGQKIAAGPVGKIAGKIGGVFSSLGKSIGPVLGGPLKALGGLFGGLFGKAMPVIAIISALSIALLKLTGNDISSFIEPFKTAFEQLKPVLQTAMTQFQQLGKDMLPLIMNAAKQLAPLLGQIVTAILPVVIQLIQSLVPLICQLVKDLLPVILNIITSLAPLFTEIITSVLPIVVQLLQTLLPIVSQIVTSILPIVVEVLNMIMPLVTELIQAVLPILMTILQALMPIIQALAELFGGVLGSAIEAIKPIIESLTGVLKGIIDFITGVFTGDWEKAFGGIVDIAKNIWETIKNIFGGIIDFFKGIGEGIGNFFSNLFGGKKKVDVDADIPQFESGSDSTPDTFIAGDVNGKGGELVTGARGRKVFTAAQTSAIFENIKAAKAVNSAPKQGLFERVGNAVGAAKTAISERLQGTPFGAQNPSGGEPKFVINYNPTIYVNGDKPDDLEEKLKQNNEKLLQMFREELRQQKETERRTAYA